ncbi:Putative deoxyribonuclease RhsC [Burkholderia glumae]|nr:Putative deoxyribonuclease RhsC [Burkholderia glumae]
MCSRSVCGWDGDTLAYESADEHSTHYLYELETFVPMAQYAGAPVNGIETPAAASTDRYTPEDDPLQRGPAAAAHLVFYHCDQIGTPLMMTDEAGELVWEASYRAWGEAQEVIERASAAAGIDVVRNPPRFQGQQFDDETGQHYNRYRYYDPGSSRFVNKDPIGLTGGINIYQYAPNPISWIDPLGLQRTLTGTTKGGMSRCSSGWRDRYGPASMREHHLIPQAMMNNDNFMAQMKNAGVSDPEDYIHRQIAQISNAQHIDVHEGGWNKDWQSWYQNNPNFTRKDLEALTKSMMKDYNIPRSSRNFAERYGSGC